MEKERRIKIISIVALVLAVCGMSLGFAAFSTSLNISSQASITPNSDTFSVKFSTSKDELVAGDVVPSEISSGLTASNGIIDNSAAPTLKNLSVEFTMPGQYVEYTFYARNEGEYTAYLNNVYFDGQKQCSADDGVDKTLVDSACDSINLLVYVNGEEYTDTTEIAGHALAKGAVDEVKIRISYDESGQVMTDAFNIKFGNIAMIYSTIDDSTYIPPDSTLGGKVSLMESIKEGAVLDTSVTFNTAPTAGTYIFNSTSNNANPIYYYRGAVTNNNVRFANFCWKIVRTTETGGIKLIYNGVPAEDGSCNNTGTASQIGTSDFNSPYTSPSYVGYMYGTVYTVTTKTLTDQTDAYLYGNDVSWDGTNYTLTDTMTSSSWSADYKTIATKYHYTCFNNTGICENVNYINHFGDANKAFYLTLKEGKNIEKAKEEMFTNTTDSKIKTTIDNWYASNMTSYTNKLEDTVWCNDRTLTTGPLLSKDTNSIGSSLFATNSRNITTFKPSVTCTNTRDSFTVDSSNGNGKLTYPVGLLTADEYTLAGSGNKGYSTDAYLHTGQTQLSLSPSYFGSDGAIEFVLYSSGYLTSTYVHGMCGVRPSVSLKPRTYVSGGDGSVTSPYIIE